MNVSDHYRYPSFALTWDPVILPEYAAFPVQHTRYNALRTLPIDYEIYSSEQDFPTGTQKVLPGQWGRKSAIRKTYRTGQ